MTNTLHARRENAETFLSTREVASRLGVHPITLAKWRITGEGPAFVRLSRRAIRYAESSLAAWASERTRLSTAA